MTSCVHQENYMREMFIIVIFVDRGVGRIAMGSRTSCSIIILKWLRRLKNLRAEIQRLIEATEPIYR